MKAFQNIKALLNKDLSGEGVNNSRIILIRYISAILAVWYAIVGIFCLIMPFGGYAIEFFATAVGFGGVLYGSYRTDNNKQLLGVMSMIIVVSSFVITSAFGWRISFQNYLYVTLVLLWYDAEITNRIKAFLSLLTSAIVCVISLTTRFGITVLDPSSLEYHIITFINIAVFCYCLSLVAYFFCTQYIASEQKLMMYNQKLKHIADIDPLTQLMNRRSAMEEIHNISEKFATSNNSVSIAIGDIDFFKKVNDTYGHDCGDYVLQTVAGLFSSKMEGKGFVCRWGGEEFLFVFSSMNGDEAFVELNDLREDIEKFHFMFKSNEFRLTMTFGVDEFSNNVSVDEIIKAADEKLYMGKENGRNQVVF